MPRIEKSMFKGLDLAKFVSADRTTVEEVLEVTVLSDTETFDRFVISTYDAIASRWDMYHPGGDFPVTQEAFTRYAYTAVRARVARVRNERFYVRCDDSWTVPAPLASVLAGLGNVLLEAPILEIRPKWDPALDARLLNSYDEWQLISRRLRAVEKDDNCKFIFAHAIEGGRGGDEALMCLIPVRDAAGRTVRLEGGVKMEVDPIAALAYLVLGLEPQDAVDAALPVHSLRRAAKFFPASALERVVDKLAEASVG